MKPFKMPGILLWCLAVLWLVFLTFLSSQSGPDTGRLSRWLADIVTRLLRLAPRYRWEVEALLRTAAHFVCFFGLGALLYAALRMTRQKLGNIHFWAAGIVSVLGVLDEVKKVFIIGRHLSWAEAGLNVIGAWCGIIAAMVVIELVSAGPKAGNTDEISKVKSNAA